MSKILWVDDEIEMLKPHIVFLESKGYSVTSINNVNEALELIEENSFARKYAWHIWLRSHSDD